MARIDRTQAAKLYAGNIEYGYFVRGMEARCQAAGMSQYTDASQLINMAASLSEDALRCTLSSCQCNTSLVVCSIPVLCEQLSDLAGQRFGVFHANSSCVHRQVQPVVFLADIKRFSINIPCCCTYLLFHKVTALPDMWLHNTQGSSASEVKTGVACCCTAHRPAIPAGAAASNHLTGCCT